MAKRFQMKLWARLGAEQKLQQLDDERATILRAFPGLHRAGRSLASVVDEGEARSTRRGRRRRRRLSAEARQRISEVQKARWAKWRKARGKR